MHRQLSHNYGEDYCIIPFKKSEKEKYSAVITKFINASTHKNVNELSQQI